MLGYYLNIMRGYGLYLWEVHYLNLLYKISVWCDVVLILFIIHVIIFHVWFIRYCVELHESTRAGVFLHCQTLAGVGVAVGWAHDNVDDDDLKPRTYCQYSHVFSFFFHAIVPFRRYQLNAD